MRVAACLLVLGLLVAGCGGKTETGSSSPTWAAPPPPGAAFTENFDSLAVGAAPSNWTNTGATWRVIANSTAPSTPNVIQGTGSPTKGRTSLLLDPAGSFGDFEAQVRFQIVSGEHPQGAGLSFRFKDPEHYTLIRFSTSEQGWHIFVADGGEADKQNSASLPVEAELPVLGEWIELRIEARGSHIQAWWNGTLVIDYTETSESVPHSGTLGLFLRGESVALFDDLVVKPL